MAKDKGSSKSGKKPKVLTIRLDELALSERDKNRLRKALKARVGEKFKGPVTVRVAAEVETTIDSNSEDPGCGEPENPSE